MRPAKLVEELPLLRLGQLPEVGARDWRGSDGNSRPDVDEESARVPVGIDEDHRQPLSHGEVDRALDVLRETLHRLPRDAADVHLGHGDEAEPPRRAPERVVAVRVRVAEVAGLDERVRQPGDGRLREAGSHRDLLVGQPAVPRVETAQHLQAAPERGHVLPIDRGPLFRRGRPRLARAARCSGRTRHSAISLAVSGHAVPRRRSRGGLPAPQSAHHTNQVLRAGGEASTRSQSGSYNWPESSGIDSLDYEVLDAATFSAASTPCSERTFFTSDWSAFESVRGANMYYPGRPSRALVPLDLRAGLRVAFVGAT